MFAAIPFRCTVLLTTLLCAMSTEPEPTPSEAGTEMEPESENVSHRTHPMTTLEQGIAANVVNFPPPPLPEDNPDPITGRTPRLNNGAVNRIPPFPGWPPHLARPDGPEFENTGVCPECGTYVRQEHWERHIATPNHLRKVRLGHPLSNLNNRIWRARREAVLAARRPLEPSVPSVPEEDEEGLTHKEMQEVIGSMMEERHEKLEEIRAHSAMVTNQLDEIRSHHAVINNLYDQIKAEVLAGKDMLEDAKHNATESWKLWQAI